MIARNREDDRADGPSLLRVNSRGSDYMWPPRLQARWESSIVAEVDREVERAWCLGGFGGGTHSVFDFQPTTAAKRCSGGIALASRPFGAISRRV
jgi:hypothetical protein